MNDNNFYIGNSLFVIIFVIAAFLMIMIYKLLAKVSLEKKNKQKKVNIIDLLNRL